MAFTQADLDRINKAIANGTLTVEIDGHRVAYRTMNELIQAKAEIAKEIAAASGSPAIRQTFAQFSRD